MRIDTANKLLKLIEEPTDNTLMLFVSENADRLLPTILSRLQKVFVPRLEDAQAAAGLARLSGVSQEQALGWVHITEGNIAAANRLAQSGSETPRSRALHGLDARMLGSRRRSDYETKQRLRCPRARESKTLPQLCSAHDPWMHHR